MTNEMFENLREIIVGMRGILNVLQQQESVDRAILVLTNGPAAASAADLVQLLDVIAGVHVVYMLIQCGQNGVGAELTAAGHADVVPPKMFYVNILELQRSTLECTVKIGNELRRRKAAGQIHIQSE